MVTLLAIVCLVPFLMIVTGSFTAEEAIYRDGFRLIPKEWSLESYRLLLEGGVSLARAYQVTAVLTVVGTAPFPADLLHDRLCAVPQGFPLAQQALLFFYFTTLFSGGLVPWYILIAKYLNLRNNPLSMLIPGLVSVFNILIMRNFLKSIPIPW